jgi:DNA repair protein RadC
MQRGRNDQARVVDSLEAALSLFAPALARATDERLHIAHLDEGDRLIDLRIRLGSDERRVHLALRSIIAGALELHSAALILAHNHPSGDPEPSAADIEATRSLVQVARPLGIAVRDHLVFSGERFVSFRARGLL